MCPQGVIYYIGSKAKLSLKQVYKVIINMIKHSIRYKNIKLTFPWGHMMSLWRSVDEVRGVTIVNGIYIRFVRD